MNDQVEKWGEKYARKADAFASTDHWLEEVKALVLPHVGDAKTVLDLGCNTGRLLQLIAQDGLPRNLVGVDPNEHGLKILKSRMPEVVVADSVSQLATGSVDFVAMVHCINQIEDLDLVLMDLWRVMAAGGRLVVLTHNPIYGKVYKTLPNLFNGYKSDATMSREPTMGGCAHLLYENGFKTLAKTRFGPQIVPVFKYRYAVLAEKPA